MNISFLQSKANLKAHEREAIPGKKRKKGGKNVHEGKKRKITKKKRKQGNINAPTHFSTLKSCDFDVFLVQRNVDLLPGPNYTAFSWKGKSTE